MESLFQTMERLLERTPVRIVRSMMEHINWDRQLISIRGSRGVGKSTLLRQYIKLNYPRGSREALYCSLDSFYFNNHTILELAETFYLHGGRHLFLDEVHKYSDWSSEIKEIYDSYPNLKIVVSGSSILHLLKGDADLSRRCLPYYMPGLSMREFLQFYKDITIAPCSLEDLLSDPYQIAARVREVCSPIAIMDEYCTHGYYPFYDGHDSDYYLQLENVVNYIVEQELPLLSDFKMGYVRKIKALLGVLSTSKPFEVDISKMAKLLEINRETVLSYIQILSKANLLNLLYSDLSSVKRMQKPDKIYLNNTNLLYALSESRDDEGNRRETFVISQLSPFHKVEYGKEAGDFLVDSKWRFEIGGAKKGFSQIADIENSYVFADNIEYTSGNKLPLWLLGFLY